MTDLDRCPNPAATIANLPAGAGVIVRDYGLTDRRQYAAKLVEQARQQKIVILIAADRKLALALKADGVHWPGWALQNPTPKKGLNPNGWIETCSAHGAMELKLAADWQMDGVFLSPVFQTGSHKGAKPLGILTATHLAASSTVPVFALGGITRQTVHRLDSSIFSGFGAISGFDPR